MAAPISSYALIETLVASCVEAQLGVLAAGLLAAIGTYWILACVVVGVLRRTMAAYLWGSTIVVYIGLNSVEVGSYAAINDSFDSQTVTVMFLSLVMFLGLPFAKTEIEKQVRAVPIKTPDWLVEASRTKERWWNAVLSVFVRRAGDSLHWKGRRGDRQGPKYRGAPTHDGRCECCLAIPLGGVATGLEHALQVLSVAARHGMDLMKDVLQYLVSGGMVLLVTTGLGSCGVKETKGRVVGARVDLRTMTNDSVRVALIDSRGEQESVAIGGAVINRFLGDEMPNVVRNGKGDVVRVVIPNSGHAEVVRIERGPGVSSMLQVDGVAVAYPESTEYVTWGNRDGGGGDPLEVLVTAEGCQAVTLSVVQVFRGNDLPELMKALSREVTGSTFVAESEFRVEVRSAVEERTESQMSQWQVEPTAANAVIEPVILFERGSGKITAVALRDLGKLVATLSGRKQDGTLVIEGHTCKLGAPAYNRKLGMERANAVHNALVELGLVWPDIESVSYGECRPVSDDFVENRRVRIMVRRLAQ